MTNSLPVARGPLVELYRAGSARMTTVNRWEIIAEFDGTAAELARSRAQVGVTDLSHLSKLEVVGRSVGAFCSKVVPPVEGEPNQPAQPGRSWMASLGDYSPLTTHHSLLWAWLSEDQLVAMSLAPQEPGGSGTLIERARDHGIEGVQLLDATGQFAVFELVGPGSKDVLRRVTALEVSADEFRPGQCAQTGVARIPLILIRPPVSYRPSSQSQDQLAQTRVAGVERSDPSGTPDGPRPTADSRFQLWCDRDYGQYLWETLLDGARPLGGGPLGWDAWQNSF